MLINEELEELKRRKQIGQSMGGPEKIKRQHDRGKLTARERISLLADAGSYREYGMLGTHQSNRPEMAGKITPADGVITGFANIDGRRMAIIAEDFTVMGGTMGMTHFLKDVRIVEIATQERMPIVWLLDGAGARAEETMGSGLPAVWHFLKVAKLSGIAPQVGVVMGACAGDSSLFASFMEFVIMVKGTGMLAAGGPPIVLRATGEKVTKEELGGWKIHCITSGVADNPVENDEEAIKMAKKYMSYMPRSAYEYPPTVATSDDPNRMDEELLHIIPENCKQPYDMKRIINCVVDKESFFEIKPLFAPMLITGLARMNGNTVGIIANQPMHMAGAITAKAAQKERHFIDLCNSYHIPLIFLQDVPGVMTGPQSEKEGALKYGLAVAYSLAWAQVPKITVVIHKSFGYGGCAMCGYGAKQILTLAWPTADFSALPPESGVLAGHSAQLKEAKDPEALKRQLEEDYKKYCSAYAAAETFNLDDVIDPRETRPRIIEALDLAVSRRVSAPVPVMRHGVMP